MYVNGYETTMRSQLGVRASVIALAAVESPSPHPSKTHKIIGRLVDIRPHQMKFNSH